MEKVIPPFAPYEECPVENQLQMLSLFTFARQKLDKDYVFKGEVHDFTEVVCVTEGKVGITADKNVYVLSAGQMIVHPPSEFHAIWSTEGTSPEVIIFSFSAPNLPDVSRHIYSLTAEQIADVKAIQKDAEHAFHVGMHSIKLKEGKKLRASVVLKKLEIFLLTALSSKAEELPEYTGKSAANYMRILSVMKQNLDKPLTTKQLSDVCSVSVPTLEKTMFRYVGTGAIAYFNALKLQRAKELLTEGNSVKEVAFMLGFSNQNYFSSFFKKFVGIPPSQWKKE